VPDGRLDSVSDRLRQHLRFCRHRMHAVPSSRHAYETLRSKALTPSWTRMRNCLCSPAICHGRGEPNIRYALPATYVRLEPGSKLRGDLPPDEFLPGADYGEQQFAPGAVSDLPLSAWLVAI